jgi:hypothetical protein
MGVGLPKAMFDRVPQSPQLLRIMRGSPMAVGTSPPANAAPRPEPHAESRERPWTVREDGAARLGVALFGENWGNILNNSHFAQVCLQHI